MTNKYKYYNKINKYKRVITIKIIISIFSYISRIIIVFFYVFRYWILLKTNRRSNDNLIVDICLNKHKQIVCLCIYVYLNGYAKTHKMFAYFLKTLFLPSLPLILNHPQFILGIPYFSSFICKIHFCVSLK